MRRGREGLGRWVRGKKVGEVRVLAGVQEVLWNEWRKQGCLMERVIREEKRGVRVFVGLRKG